MNDVRAVLLKAGATVITVATMVGSAVYVSAHVKNPSAPLRPSVRTSNVTPVTSTYAS